MRRACPSTACRPTCNRSRSLATPPDESSWLGVTLVPPTGDLDILLLPAASACALNTKVGFVDGMIFGAADAHTLVVSGGVVNGTLPKSYRVDLDTGKIDAMSIGLHQARLRSAFAPFGDAGQAIVAGGVSVSTPILRGDAEVYDPASSDFDPTAITIAPRTDFAAVTLASGDVLLVGGRDDKGLVPDCERVVYDPDPTKWVASSAGMPVLDGTPGNEPRTSPYALRMSDGNILVGGGFDASGSALASVLFFSPDATTPLAPASVPARSKHAFVALDDGTALFVTAPEASDDPATFPRAWIVKPGSQTAIEPTITAQLDDVKLFPRAGGGALLWTGSTWLAFDPWNGFGPLAGAPPTGPDVGSPLATPDPGLHAWVGLDGSISVWRDSVRNAFSTDGTYLTAANTTALMVPNTSTWPPPSFDVASGLALLAGDSAFVADSRYLDVAIDVDAPNGKIPLVVLSGLTAQIVVGDASCPYPTSSANHVHVERRGANVSYALDGGTLTPCTTIAPDARVSVGLRGANAGSNALDFSVARLTRDLH